MWEDVGSGNNNNYLLIVDFRAKTTSAQVNLIRQKILLTLRLRSKQKNFCGSSKKERKKKEKKKKKERKGIERKEK